MPSAPTSPATPYAVVRRLLADAARCPACTAVLARSTCDACGLDLSGVPGQQLWELSRSAADALGRRDAHLQAMRSRQVDRATAPSQATARSAMSGAVSGSVQGAPHTRPPAAAPSRAAASGSLLGAAHRPVAAPAPLVPRAARPHWRVQTVLQVLGAGLLAAASIVFLVFSWGWIGLTGRAVTVAVGTVVVFALAGRLRRAALRSSAEAVGALGTVMLLLDAWAVAATGLVTVTSPSTYAAAAALVCAALLLAGSRATHLRVARVVGTGLVPLAPILLVPAASGPSVAAWLLISSVVLAGARFAIDRPTPTTESSPPDEWVETDVLTGAAWLMTGAGALLAVGGVLTGARGDGPAGVGALGALASLAVVQVWLTRRPPVGGAAPAIETRRSWRTTADSATWWAAAAGALTAMTAGSAAVTACALLDLTGGAALAAVPAAGAAIAAVAAVGAARTRGAVQGVAASGASQVREWVPARVAEAAADSSLLVVLVSGAPAVLVLPFAAARAVLEPGGPNRAALAVGSVIGAGVVAALLGLAVRPSVAARPARRCAAWLAAATVLGVPAAAGSAIPPLDGTGTVALFLLTAAAAYGADRRSLMTYPARQLLRAPLRALSTLAAAGALAAAHGSPWLVAAVLAALAALALGVRAWLVGLPRAQAAATGSAVVTTWGAMLVGFAAAGVRSPLGMLLAGGTGLVLVTPAALSPDARWRRLDRCTTLATTSVLAATGWLAGLVASGRAGQPPALAPFVVLVGVLASVAVVGVLVGGAQLLGGRTRRVAGAVFAPVLSGAVVSLHVALGAPDGPGLAAGIAGVGASSVLLALPLAGIGAQPRRLPDAGVRRVLEWTGWLTAGLALTVAVDDGWGAVALVLLVGAITAGAWALQPDRRTARWGVLVLGVAASWVVLHAGDVGVPEAYLAPAGLALTVVGARRRRLGALDDVPLLAAGLALALVPTALLDGAIAGRVPRVALTLAAGALVVAIGLSLRAATPPDVGAVHRHAPIEAIHVLLLIGQLVVVLGPARHALSAAITASSGSGPHLAAAARIETWSGAAALVVATATAGLVRRWHWAAPSPRTWGWWLVAAVAATPSLVAVDGTPAGFVRWTVPLAIGAGLGLHGARMPQRPGASPDRPRARYADATLLVGLGLTLAAAAAVVAAARSPLPPDVPVAVLGVVVTAAGVARWRRLASAATVSSGPWLTAPWQSAPWPLAGPFLLLPTAVDQAGVWRAPAALAGAAVLVAAGLLLARPVAVAAAGGDDGHDLAARGSVDRARDLLLVGGAMLAAAGPGVRATVAAVRGPDPSGVLSVEAWSLPAAALIGVVAVALLRAWSEGATSRTADRRRWGLAAVLTVAAVPTLLSVDGSTTGLLRVAALVTASAALAISGTLGAEGARRNLGLALTAAVTVAWMLRDGPEPADLAVVVAGCLLLVVGTLDRAAGRARSTWRGLGPGLLLALVVPLATGWVHPTAWRLLVVLVGAVAAVVIGAVRRWQAPFVVGGAVLVVLAVVQLSPAAAAALRVVEWWMLLAVGGATLLGLGLTYERRLREAKEAVRFVATMR